MRTLFLSLFLIAPLFLFGQETIQEIDIEQIVPNTVKKYWLEMIDNGMGQPVSIPVIIAKGQTSSPVLGLVAAIHGNELNGIGVIQRVMDDLDIKELNGTIIAIPGLNGISLPLHRRRYVDEEDLNRHFPGKQEGNRSQQYVWQINQKILSKVDYLVDMHTASFGRENTLYVRADLSNAKIEQMAKLQDADIILNNKGIPSAGGKVSTTRTMRAEAMLKGIPTITVEYGNPQVFQADMIERGKNGIENIMSWLGMTKTKIRTYEQAVMCKKSYWIYVEEGGYLDLIVALKQEVNKDELIAVMRNPFGDIIHKYYSPEAGIVIGRSSNPINMSGGRIIHLGIKDEEK